MLPTAFNVVSSVHSYVSLRFFCGAKLRRAGARKPPTKMTNRRFHRRAEEKRLGRGKFTSVVLYYMCLACLNFSYFCGNAQDGNLFLAW